MQGFTRRGLIKAAATGPAVLAAGSTLVQAQASDADAIAEAISAKLFADDGLARPIPETPTVSDLAKGLDRTLVLGGGGEYYVAWYCGFFHGLLEQNVDLGIAEMVVGTSAGAYAGSALTSGHFARMRNEFDFFGYFPSLFAKIAPVASPNLSQKRAQEINFSVKDGSPSSIRAIGHAALAADNHVNGSAVERLAALLTGDSRTGLTAAHRTLKFGTRVKVTHLRSGRSVIVRINDRGPFIKSRIIDLSLGAAVAIGVDKSGVANVRVVVLPQSARISSK